MTSGGLAVYIHWPFCQSKCPYCDFNSHVREAVDEARFRAALVAEIDYFAGLGQRAVAIGKATFRFITAAHSLQTRLNQFAPRIRGL